MATDKSPKAAGAALRALRRRIDHTCPECETVFQGVVEAKFCSNRCRQRAKNRRIREAKDSDSDSDSDAGTIWGQS